MIEVISVIQKHVGPVVRIEAATPLMTSGLIDSFQLATLIDSLEAHFKVIIDPREIGVDNFDTPKQIHNYIQSKR
jgi:acyl carrier protein